jgi:hypothetical protein
MEKRGAMKRILQYYLISSATMACMQAYDTGLFPSYSYERVCDSCYRPKKIFKSEAPALRCLFNSIGSAMQDVIDLHLNIISKETFIVIAATMSPYLISRQIDDHIQCHFFSHTNHKNINQCPHWCKSLVRFGIGVPIVAFGSQLFLSRDPEWREAAWMLLLGIPFVIFGKDVIKTFDADFCLRPWHEDFCQDHKRGGGGFPSGHMAQASYIATLYGMRFGPKLAVPLTFFAAALGIIFVNCNRHYLSQLIAGAGLGAIYGIAANKVIDRKLSESWNVGLCIDRHGAGIKARYEF